MNLVTKYIVTPIIAVAFIMVFMTNVRADHNPHPENNQSDHAHHNTTMPDESTTTTTTNYSINYLDNSTIAMAASQIDMSQHNKHFQLGVGLAQIDSTVGGAVSIGYGTGKQLYKLTYGRTSNLESIAIGGVWKF